MFSSLRSLQFITCDQWCQTETNPVIDKRLITFRPFTDRDRLRHVLTVCTRNLCAYLCASPEPR